MQKEEGFTLIELLIVIAIIGILAGILFVSIGQEPLQKAKISVAVSQQRQLQRATQMYYMDMGFYPPDTSRGEDPGFAKPLPYNDDSDAPTPFDCNIDFTHCSSMASTFSWLPSNWKDIVASNWHGPYMSAWPEKTPWGGKYDYNNWPSGGGDRYGCTVTAGIYIGVQGDYANNNTIPQDAEQVMIDKHYEAEECMNGESQMILVKF